jgi:ADP-ribose pyrophosphatase
VRVGVKGMSEHLEPAKARGERPPIYPPRFSVPEAKAPWDTPFKEYAPPYFVAPVVLANDKPGGWADPEDLAKLTRKLQSYEGAVRRDSEGRPLNPSGRTGIAGRGLLGRWGANFAADPLVTRDNPKTGELEMLAIKRKDNGQWAIPGGMVDAGEDVSATLAREFKEETGVTLDMNDAAEIYRGYVDDPRNTDHAWMETTVKHKHLDAALAAKLEPKAGDDAAAVQWLALTDDNLDALYASHGDFVRRALELFESE